MYPLSEQRYKWLKYFVGSGIDVGCGKRGERITTTAIGVDNAGPNITVAMDYSTLDLFADGRFDYVFVGDILSSLPDYKETLKDYWRVLKSGGYLLVSNKNLETSSAGIFHSLSADSIITALSSFVKEKYEIIEKDTYLIKQRFDLVIGKETKEGRIVRPSKDKIIWVIRYGAIGDQLISSSILPHIKTQDNYVIWNCQEYGSDILQHNPYIDEFIIQPKDCFAWTIYKEYWKWIEENVANKVINLSASVEEALLKPWWTPEFYMSKEFLEEKCKENYYINQFKQAGIEPIEMPRGQIFLTEEEEDWFKTEFKPNLKTNHYICWSLSGSSLHKAYPYAEQVAKDILAMFPDISIVTLGGETDRLLEWEHPRILKGCSVLSVRQSAIVIKYAKILVTPETGFMHMAGALETPCVPLLSHSSAYNEVGTFKEVYPVEPEQELAPCYPCHKLHHLRGHCPEVMIAPDFSFPICMGKGVLPKKLGSVIIRTLRKKLDGNKY